MLQIKFRYKNKMYEGVGEIETRIRQINIEDGDYETIPVRVGDTIYVVPKEKIITIVNMDKLTFEEKKVREKKEYEKKMCIIIRHILKNGNAINLKNETLKKILDGYKFGDLYLPFAKKFRDNGRLKLRKK